MENSLWLDRKRKKKEGIKQSLAPSETELSPASWKGLPPQRGALDLSNWQHRKQGSRVKVLTQGKASGPEGRREREVLRLSEVLATRNTLPGNGVFGPTFPFSSCLTVWKCRFWQSSQKSAWLVGQASR